VTRARERQKARNLSHAQLDMALAPPPRHDWAYGSPEAGESLRCKNCGARMRFVTVSAGKHSVVQAEFRLEHSNSWSTPRPPCKASRTSELLDALEPKTSEAQSAGGQAAKATSRYDAPASTDAAVSRPSRRAEAPESAPSFDDFDQSDPNPEELIEKVPE